MANVRGCNIPEDRLYDVDNHIWFTEVGDGTVKIGMTAVATAMSGPQVYNSACLACHGAGIGGAPILGDAAQWVERVAQGADTLREHALQGFSGTTGYMPPKGGRLDLSDSEIEAAVDYMVGEAQ